MQEVDMVEDTSVASLEELAYMMVGRMVACKEMDMLEL